MRIGRRASGTPESPNDSHASRQTAAGGRVQDTARHGGGQDVLNCPYRALAVLEGERLTWFWIGSGWRADARGHILPSTRGVADGDLGSRRGAPDLGPRVRRRAGLPDRCVAHVLVLEAGVERSKRHEEAAHPEGGMFTMNENAEAWGFLRPLTWQHVLLVLAVFLAAKLLSGGVRWLLQHWAERVRPRLRLSILRLIPLARLVFGTAAVVVAVPILVEPTLRNVVTLVASVGLALAFALKDYGSSLVAGLATVLENTYQPGDWIEVDGIYGEVKSIDSRAVRIMTPYDTEVIVPHSTLWSHSISNATSGNRSLLCVADFYLHPDHDAAAAQRRLTEIAVSSSYRKADKPVAVIVQEKPWGTHYKLKAYVKESREQFDFITDLTIRGKEALRAMGIRFAQAPYAETKRLGAS